MLRTISSGVPLTHGIDAARKLAGGAQLSDVQALLVKEAVIGACYLLAGLVLLRIFERQGRESGALDLF